MGFHIHDWIRATNDAPDKPLMAAETVGFDPDCFSAIFSGEEIAMILSGVIMAQYKNPLTCITPGEAEIIAKALELGYRIIKDQGLSQDDVILVEGLQARAQIAAERLKD